MRKAPQDLGLAVAGGFATLAAAAGLMPLLETGSWPVLVALGVAVVVLVGLGLRELGLPGLLVAAGQALALLLFAGHQVAGEEARAGWLPSQEWVQELLFVGREGVLSIEEYAPPVPVDDGLLLLLVVGVGLVALAVDVLAVQRRHAAWAGVPLLGLHGVASLVAREASPVWLFLLAAAGYLLLLAVDARDRARRWGRPMGAHAASAQAGATTGSSGLIQAGIPLALAVLVVAATLPMLLPEGGWRALSGAAGSGEGGSTVIRTENPIVDLRRDLVQPENVELFSFTTSESQPDYLRTISLETFDGTTWDTELRDIPSTQAVSAGLPPPPGLAPDVPVRTAQYAIEMTTAFESRWLPLPYPTETVEVEGDWRFDSDTLDVIARDEVTTAGLTYQAQALAIDVSAEDLQGRGERPDSVANQLALPADLPDLVRGLATEVTAGAEDPLEAAVALQRWFRDPQRGGFVYSTETQPGHSSNDLVAFLEDRSGYCEQFAATMAIMARVVGIPSRVAVGFLPGEETQPGLWSVTADDSHAWPELYFDGIGWVRFEPTPAEQTGAAPAYSVPANDSAGGAEEDLDADGRASLRNEEGADAGGRPEADTGPQVNEGDAAAATWRILRLAGVSLLLVLAVAPAAIGLVRRRWRWRGSVRAEPGRSAEAAWDVVVDSAAEAGIEWSPSTTVRDAAGWLDERLELDAAARAALGRILHGVERSRFASPASGPGAPSGDQAESMRHDAELLRSRIRAAMTPGERAKSLLWPAPLRRGRARRQIFLGEDAAQDVQAGWSSGLSDPSRRDGDATALRRG